MISSRSARPSTNALSSTSTNTWRGSRPRSMGHQHRVDPLAAKLWQLRIFASSFARVEKSARILGLMDDADADQDGDTADQRHHAGERDRKSSHELHAQLLVKQQPRGKRYEDRREVREQCRIRNRSQYDRPVPEREIAGEKKTGCNQQSALGGEACAM